MSESLRIAVADDEPVMKMYLEETVAGLGFRVVAAAKDGVELISACRAEQPDLVITDIMMPRMDGFRAVKELSTDMAVPVVFITGYDERDRALGADADCVFVYLMKPIGEAELRSAIELALQRFRQFEVLLSEAQDRTRALMDLRRVERAKGVLMRRLAMDDGKAFEWLERKARERGTRIVDEAAEILPPTALEDTIDR